MAAELSSLVTRLESAVKKLEGLGGAPSPAAPGGSPSAPAGK